MSNNGKAGMSNHENVVDLGEYLTIQEVSENYTKFRAAADLSNVLILDVSNLSRIDGAGLQLLCAMFEEAIRQKMDLSWKGQSDVVSKSAAQMGLVSKLQLGIEG